MSLKDETKKDQVIEAQDFTSPNGLSVDEQIANATLKIEARIKAQLSKASSNSIQLGVTVRDMDSKEGADILDKTTKEPLMDNWGNPRKYPNKYYVTFVFQGGSLQQEVKEKHYLNLQIGKKYFATGYLGEVSVYGKAELAPIFTEFEALDL